MDFKEAYNLKIGNHVEKKGKFNYLSWCFAVKFLRENFKGAVWYIKEDPNGLPFFKTPKGYMVCVIVIVDDLSYPQWHAVTNNKNKPIEEPDNTDISNAIQRCLTKAIGLASGIGLGLYAGEDLPLDDEADDAEYLSLDQKLVLTDLIKEVKADIAGFFKYFKVESLDDMPTNKYELAVKLLQSKAN